MPRETFQGKPSEIKFHVASFETQVLSLGTEQGGYALGSGSAARANLHFQQFITSELKILVFQFGKRKGGKSVTDGRRVCTGSGAFSDFALLCLVNKNCVRLQVKL